MEAYFSDDVVAGLRKAAEKAAKKRGRLCVHVDDEIFPILSMEDSGFVLDGENTPHLRGLVDIYDGARHLWQCLIVRAEHGPRFTHYEYKRQTAADGVQPRDYASERPQPIGLLPGR